MSLHFFVAPDGRTGYRVRVNLGKNRDGKYVSKCKTIYGTAIQARALEEQMKNTADRVKTAEVELEILNRTREIRYHITPIKIAHAFDLAINNTACNCTSETRQAFRRNYWEDFTAFMKKNFGGITVLQKVTERHAELYIAHLRKTGPFLSESKVKLAPDTINAYHSTLKMVFDVLTLESGMVINPFKFVKKMKAVHAERNAYTEEQLRTIFDRADEYLYPLFFIGLFTGLSEGDVCTLKKSEINFSHRHIYRKRNKTRNYSNTVSAIPILPTLNDFIQELCEKNPDSEYLLPEQAADYERCRSTVSKRIKRFLEIDCEFETTSDENGKRTRKQSVLDFHSLRHTFCSMAGCAGIPITVVQSIVGHMSPSMTALYSRHVEEKDRLRWIGMFGASLEENVFGVPENKQIPQDGEADSEKMALMQAIQGMTAVQVKELLSTLQK